MAIIVVPLTLVDVDAGSAIEGLLVALVAGALKRSPGVDALLLAPMIWQLTFVDIAAIVTIA